MKTVAFQGERGAYSEEAVLQHYGQANPLPCRTFLDVFEAVEEGAAHEGLIPIENSLAGSINDNYDLLLRRSLTIVGETILRVKHCLLILPESDPARLVRVYSHPQALAQCAEFIRMRGLEPVAVYDTAGGAKMLADSRARDCSAIAARRAGELYGLCILAEGIETDPNNFTRFYAVSKHEAAIPPGQKAKTVLVFSTAHEPGSLYSCLGAFARRGINLLKIESRPIHGRPWEYLFYAEIEGDSSAAPVRESLRELQRSTVMLKVLGSFPASDVIFGQGP